MNVTPLYTHTHTHTHIINGIERVDKEDLVMMKEEVRRTRGHSKKIRKSGCVGDIRRNSFPHRTVDTWNGLSDEVVSATNVHSFKEKLHKWRYGDRTL